MTTTDQPHPLDAVLRSTSGDVRVVIRHVNDTTGTDLCTIPLTSLGTDGTAGLLDHLPPIRERDVTGEQHDTVVEDVAIVVDGDRGEAYLEVLVQ